MRKIIGLILIIFSLLALSGIETRGWSVSGANDGRTGFVPSSESYRERMLTGTISLPANPANSPVIFEDTLIIGLENRDLSAFNLNDKKMVWTVKNGASPNESATIGDDGYAYSATADGKIRALELKTGRIHWEVDIKEQIKNSMIARGTKLYVTTAEGSVFALDTITGNTAWKYSLNSASPATPPSLCGDILIVASKDKNIHGINAAKGEKEWIYTTTGGFLAAPTILNDLFALGSLDGTFYCFNSSGNLAWNLDLKSPINLSAANNGKNFAVITQDGKLHIIDTMGTTVKTFAASGSPVSPPVILGDIIFFSTSRKRIYALEMSFDSQPWNDNLQDNPAYSMAIWKDNMVLISGKQIQLWGPSMAEKYYKEALDAKNANNHTKAMEMIEKGLEKSPASSKLRALKEELNSGLRDQGMRQFSRAEREKNPDEMIRIMDNLHSHGMVQDSAAMNSRIFRVLKALEKNATAMEYLKKAFPNPVDPRFLDEAWQINHKLGNLREATDQLKDLVNFKPQDIPLKEKLAECLIELGANEEAETLIRRILALNPNYETGRAFLKKFDEENAKDLYLKANDLWEQGKAMEALDLLQEALGLFPNFKEAQDLLSQLSKDRKSDAARAASLVAKANKIESLLQLAGIYKSISKETLPDALKLYKEVLSLDPDNKEAKEALEDMQNVKEKEDIVPQKSNSLFKSPLIRVIIGLLSIALLVMAGLFAKKQAITTDKLFARGKEAYSEDKHVKALELFNTALELDPNRSDILRLSVESQIALGQRQNALATIKRLLRNNPKDLELHLRAASMSLGFKQYDKAKELILKTLELSPEHPDASDMLIALYKETGRYDEIVSLSEKALKASPTNEKAYQNLLNAFAFMNKPDEQINTLKSMYKAMPEKESYIVKSAEAIVEKYPKIISGFILLADIARTSGSLSRALELYYKAHEIIPKDIELLYTIAQLNEKLEKYGTATENLKMIIRIDPSQIRALSSLGDIFIKISHFEDAILQYDRMLETDPDSADNVINAAKRMLSIEPDNMPATKLLGRAYITKSRFDQAVNCLRNSGEENPSDFENVQLLSLAYEKLGNWNQAIEIAERFISLVPGDMDGDKLLITLLNKAGRRAEMINAMKALLEKHPDTVDEIIEECRRLLDESDDILINNFLAQVFKSQKDTEGVIEQYTAILNRNPNNEQILEKMGRALIRAGKLAESVPYWKKVLELSPENIETRKIITTIFLEIKDYESALDELTALREREPGNHKRLINSINKIIKLAPHNRRARLLLAEILTESGRTDYAIREYEKLLELNSHDKTVYRALYRLLSSRNETERAIQQLRVLHQLEPDKVEHLYEIADCYKEAHQFREAALEYKNILKLYPAEWPHILNMIERLLVFDTNCIDALEVKSQCLANKGQHDQAIGVLESALSLEPTRLSTLIDLARLRMEAGIFDKALTCATRATELAPSDGDARKTLAEAALGAGDIDRAFAEFTTIADSGATEFEERRAMVEELILKRNITEYEMLLDDIPVSPIELQIDNRTVKVNNSLKYSKLSKENISRPELLYLLGKAYYDSARYDKAISALQRAAKDKSKYQLDALYYEAISFFHQGYRDSGRRTFEQLEEVLEDMDEEIKKDYLYRISQIYESNEMYKEGVSTLQKIIAIDFEYKDAKNRIDSLNTRKMVHEADEIRLNRIISNKYSDIKEIGVGGMGKIYKAVRIDNSQIVAIKVISEKYKDNAKALARFIQRDGKAAMRLRHPNIIHIFDVVEDPEMPHIVMEFLDGESFRQILDKVGKIPIPLVKEIAIQICSALEYAHGKEVIHRDIKPDNIMLNRDETIKIMDFGLARMLDVTVMTETGETFGTLSYMAPEQINARATDNRTDIFALGVTLYELLTGILPFQGDNPGHTMYKILNENPPSVRGINSEVPQELENIIFKCIEKDPDHRFISTTQLLEEFKRLS